MYKKFSLFLALILVIFIIAACGTPLAEANKDEPFDHSYVEVIIDKETGCEYVLFDKYVTGAGGPGGITPRLNHAGLPMCKSDNKTETSQ